MHARLFRVGWLSTWSLMNQVRSAFDSDRYQIRQMAKISQISPTFGTFT